MSGYDDKGPTLGAIEALRDEVARRLELGMGLTRHDLLRRLDAILADTAMRCGDSRLPGADCPHPIGHPGVCGGYR